MGEAGQNDDQQRLSELERQGADRRRHADLARARIAVDAVRVLVPCRLSVLESKATDMPAMKADKLPEGAHPRIVTRGLIGILPNVRAHRLERGLPEKAIDKRHGRRLISDEPVVTRERNPESAEVGKIGQAVA